MSEPERTPNHPPARGCVGRIIRWTLWGTLVATIGGIISVVGGYLWYQETVIRNPGPHLEHDHILGIIAEESPVYFRDGTTRVGVFFEDEHRQVVAFDELPPAYVIALVAAEDGAFWSHAGVNPKHIARALRDNVLAGETVSGGSTLTQQTAKNLYYRPDRSWRAKLQELHNALRLEARYTKAEILTFYVNQFHVAGNGRGIGIASSYFFDREVSKLSLVQSAYLAGLVKGPSNYDPYLGDADRQAKTKARAVARTRYVLQRIVDEPEENLVGPWPVQAGQAESARLETVRAVKAEAKKLLEEGFEIPFQRGTFRYDSNAVLDEVRRRLAEPPFADVLRAAGVDDPDKAGISVVTTLDADAQREAIYALWHHLSEVGTWMEELKPSDFVRTDTRGPRLDRFAQPRRHEFRLASVVGTAKEKGVTELDLDLGGFPCRVDRAGLVRAAGAIRRGKLKDKSAKVPGSEVDAFAAAMPVGGVVWVSVRDLRPGSAALCDLEVRPQLQGSVVAIEDGQIRAMVGGNDNQNFNRATALRQFGSTWKPLVYHAALELGWRPDDPLDNRRNVFPFSGSYYYPRPDHDPAPVVSLSWAGVNSENLASVWLLFHLVDKLDQEGLESLARALDLAPREGESSDSYKVRIQKAGVLPTSGRLREASYLQGRGEVLANVAQSAHPEDELALVSMVYGWGFGSEQERAAVSGGREQSRRERALSNTWLSTSATAERCRRQYDALARDLARGQVSDAALIPALWVMAGATRIEVACGGAPAGYVRPDAGLLQAPVAPPEGAEKPTLGERLGGLLGLGGAEAAPARQLAPWSDVLVDERLHGSTLDAVSLAITRREALLAVAEPDLYELDQLVWHQDFRVLLALRYVAEIGRQYGIRSPVRPVTSLPLGASEITLEEAALVYDGIVTGGSWTFPGRAWSRGALVGAEVASPPAPALLIAELRDVDGNVLYRAEPVARPVARPETGALTADILRNVVLHGTGTRAREAVPAGGAPWPLGGKTGTTNDFKNAAFLGYAPKWTGWGWSLEEGYTIGVYVGYDDNRPMSAGRIKLAGASGALPAWIATVEGIVDAGLLGKPAGAPAEGWTLPAPTGLGYVAVDGDRGLPLDGAVPVAPPDPEGEEEPISPDVAERAPVAPYRVLVPAAARSVPAEPTLEEVEAPVRIAPSTEDFEAREQVRRRLLETVAEPSLWDAPPDLPPPAPEGGP